MEQPGIERLLLVSFVVGLLVSCRGDPGLERGDPADRRPLFPGVASLTKQTQPHRASELSVFSDVEASISPG